MKSQTSIWKYPLEETDEQIIEVPYGAEFLSVQLQHEIPCIWAKVRTDDTILVPVKVAIVGTGNPADHTTDMRFLGTYQKFGGGLVFHVFVEA